jgi:hypothetical protein
MLREEFPANWLLDSAFSAILRLAKVSFCGQVMLGSIGGGDGLAEIAVVVAEELVGGGAIDIAPMH